MTGAFVSVAAEQDLPVELPIAQPSAAAAPPPPAPPQGTPVSLLFSAAQHDDGPPSLTTPFPVPTSGHKARSDEDEPFDMWIQRVWKDTDPTYRCEVERVSPPRVAVNGVAIPCAGHLATIYDSPSRALVEQRFGGGTFEVRIIGANPSIAGEFRVMGSKELKLPGLPKPPEDMQGGNGHGMGGYGRQPVMENTGVVNTAFATVHKLASDQMQRGDAMADKVAAERDAAQRVIDSRTDRVIDSVRELSEEKAARARVEQDNLHLASRLASIESRLSQPAVPAGPTINDQLQLVDRVAGLVRPPSNTDGFSGGAIVVEELRRQLNAANDQARKDLDNLRSEHANQIRTLQDGHRDAMASLKDDHRNMMELLKSDYRDKVEAQRASQRDDIERAREHERNAARAEVTAKQVELTSVQNELARAREDLREVKSKLEKVEEAARDRQARMDEALTAVRAELAEKKAELLHRPRAEATDPLSQLAVVERYRTAFGGGKDDRDKDDEPAPDPWPVRMFQGFMDSPMGQQVAGMLVGGLTGENDKVRRAQIAQQQINAQVARAQMARDATIAQARAAVATGGRVPPPTAGVGANPTPQGATAPVIQGMEPGDPPFPPPAPDGKVLAKEIAVYKPLLSRAELCVRGNIAPAIFLDQVCQDFQARGMAKPATLLRDDIVLKFKSHTLFWMALKGGGAAEAFTGLDHPAGQRWLKALWALVPERATIEGS